MEWYNNYRCKDSTKIHYNVHRYSYNSLEIQPNSNANISHARLSDNKTELVPEGKLVCNTLLHSICCTISHYIASHRTTLHQITVHWTTSHYIALHIDCTALHGIVLQGKSQFAHKGESSNWGKTRNMGGGTPCVGRLQHLVQNPLGEGFLK